MVGLKKPFRFYLHRNARGHGKNFPLGKRYLETNEEGGQAYFGMIVLRAFNRFLTFTLPWKVTRMWKW